MQLAGVWAHRALYPWQAGTTAPTQQASLELRRIATCSRSDLIWLSSSCQDLVVASIPTLLKAAALRPRAWFLFAFRLWFLAYNNLKMQSLHTIAVWLSALVLSLAAPDTKTIYNENRPIIGHRSPKADTVWEYLGIPYARTPVGDLRFAAPQKYKGKGTHNATNLVSLSSSVTHGTFWLMPIHRESKTGNGPVRHV